MADSTFAYPTSEPDNVIQIIIFSKWDKPIRKECFKSSQIIVGWKPNPCQLVSFLTK